MLRTGFFTLFTANTVPGLSVFPADIMIIGPMTGGIGSPGNIVIQSKILGNGDLLWAAMGAVAAACAWDRCIPLNDFPDLPDDFQSPLLMCILNESEPTLL